MAKGDEHPNDNKTERFKNFVNNSAANLLKKILPQPRTATPAANLTSSRDSADTYPIEAGGIVSPKASSINSEEFKQDGGDSDDQRREEDDYVHLRTKKLDKSHRKANRLLENLDKEFKLGPGPQYSTGRTEEKGKQKASSSKPERKSDKNSVKP